MEIFEYLFMPEETEEAAKWQEDQAKRVIAKNFTTKSPRYVAGADVSYGKRGEKAFAAVVVVDIISERVVEKATWVGEPPANYRPGFFALREVPCLFKVFEKLKQVPDIVLIDGNGLIHHRKFGLACHMGISLDIPTIGCAKSLLVGNHPPLSKKKPFAEISFNSEKIGVAMRKNRETIYVSVGHKADLTFAKDFVYNLDVPTPIDYAHNECSLLYKSEQQEQASEKDKVKSHVISIAKELKAEGMSYSKVAQELNKYSDLKKAFGKKFTPRKIRNWLEDK